MLTIPLLAGLSAEERSDVLRRCVRAHFDRGDYVFHAGEAGDSLHFIAKGRIAVFAVSRRDPLMLTVLRDGAVFGELAVLGEGRVRTATAQALEPSQTLRLRRHDLEELRLLHPTIERMLVTILVAQVERLTSQVDDLVNLTAAQRVLRKIIELADIFDAGQPGDWIPVTQDQIAAMAGAGLRATSQVLAAARQDGVIETGVRRIAVHDWPALRARAGVTAPR